MLPVLIGLPFIKVYTFGVFLVLALFWGSFFLWKNIRLTAYKEEVIFDGLFLSLASSVFFGRLLYVVLHFEDFGFSLIKFILINGYPGFSLIGSLAGFFLGFVLFCNLQKIKFMDVIDYVIPPAFLSLAIGKLGSFFSGAEVGEVTSFPLAVKYANFDGLRHITPLYESILLFIGAYIAFTMLYSIRRERLSRGFLFHFFLWYFAAVTTAFDFLRGERVMIYGYSFTLIVSALILLTFSLYFIYYFRAAIGQTLIGKLHKKNYGHTSHGGVHPKTKK